MTSVQVSLYGASLLRGSFAMDAEPLTKRHSVPVEYGSSSSTMGAADAAKHTALVPAATTIDGANTSLIRSHAFKDHQGPAPRPRAHHRHTRHHEHSDSDAGSEDTDGDDSGSSEASGSFTASGSETGGSYTTSYASMTDGGSATSTEEASSSSDDGEADDESESDEAHNAGGVHASLRQPDEVSRTIGNSRSQSSAVGGNSAFLAVSRRTVSPQVHGKAKAASSVSALPSAMFAPAQSPKPVTPALTPAPASGHHGREKRARRNSSNSVPSLPPATPAPRAYTTKSMLSGEMSMPFIFSSGSFADWPTAPPDDDFAAQSNPAKAAATRASTTPANDEVARPLSAVPQHSLLFSQMHLSLGLDTADPLSGGSGPAAAPATGTGLSRRSSPLHDEHGSVTQDQLYRAPSLMEMETMLPGRPRQSRAEQPADDRDVGEVSGVWSTDEDSSVHAHTRAPAVASRRPSTSKIEGHFASFGAYLYANASMTYLTVSRQSSAINRSSDAFAKTASDAAHSAEAAAAAAGSADAVSAEGQHAWDSSFFLHSAPGARSPTMGHLPRSGSTISGATNVRVLRGNFDNRDISLDSRFLDPLPSGSSGGASKPNSTSPSRGRAASSSGAGAVGANGVTQGSNTSAAGRTDGAAATAAATTAAAARRRMSGTGFMNIFRVASAGNPRESFSVTRSLSSNPASGLAPVSSQQTLVGGWKLLSFREQDDAPLSNVEHVPHTGKPKRKKSSKDKKKKKSKSHDRHRKPREATAEDAAGDEHADGHEDNGEHGDVARRCADVAASPAMAVLAAASDSSPVPTATEPQVTAAPSPLTRSPRCPPVLSSAEVERRDVRGSGDSVRRSGDRPLSGLKDGGNGATALPQPRVAPVAVLGQVRMRPTKAPVRTASLTAANRSAPQSRTTSAERIVLTNTSPNARPLPLAAVPAVGTNTKTVAVAPGPKPDRFEKFKEPPVASPSATVRRVTVRAGGPVTGGKSSAGTTSDNGVKRFRPASATRARPLAAPTDARLPNGLYRGLATRNGEQPRRASTRLPDRLPPL